LAGALPQTPLAKLTALPRPLAGFKGPTSGDEESRGWTRRRGDGRVGAIFSPQYFSQVGASDYRL